MAKRKISEIKEIKQKDVKDLAAHLRTMGAYVQAPNPQIVGLSNKQVIGSQDAKSLYPTIMVLLNIGYDTLRGRIYDFKTVGKIFNVIRQVFDKKKEFPDKIDSLINGVMYSLNSAISNVATDYTRREKMKASKKDFLNFTSDFYGECIRKILVYDGSFEDIMTPINDETYYLLKSALYPLLEAINWISPHNKGYSSTIIDHVFYNETFDEKYKDEQFIIFSEINSCRTTCKVLNFKEFKEQIATKFILNPYGTYFDKHDDSKSFEVDLILGGMDDRSFVKNQMLIIDAIVENWKKLSPHIQASFVLDNKKLPDHIAEEVIKLVGDSDPGVADWQLKNLKSIQFDTILSEDKLKERLELAASQRKSKSNGIKVTLNSGYGIYGMATWNYGNNLIANSITSGGKIYGIKLFQQIASNKLNMEKLKINAN